MTRRTSSVTIARMFTVTHGDERFYLLCVEGRFHGMSSPYTKSPYGLLKVRHGMCHCYCKDYLYVAVTYVQNRIYNTGHNKVQKVC